jgi:thiopurine S-methyltransferase
MNIDFWAQRWKEGRIGFHEGRTNAFLERHVGELGPAPRRVLVPLCGKTEDMAFLASAGHSVVGVEAVEDAARTFFHEHGLAPEVSARGERVRAYAAGRVTILVGDVFTVTPTVVGAVDALYDRAALVALPAPDRVRYVALVRQLLAPGSRGLLVSCEYDTSRAEPPPHSVTEDEIRSLYADARITRIDEGVLENARLHDAGADAIERCYRIEL